MTICLPASRKKTQGPAFQLTHLAAACGLLIGGAGSAVAQEAAAVPAAQPESEQVERVVVTGIRRSLDTSLTLKRDSSGIVDGIVAEDMGKFPDTNLAESMQRISGVSIDRSKGEGSKITVRGIGPDFNLVLFNNRQMPGAGIIDTGPSNSRSFDFANLASESISALEVYKTGRASTPTGGMGATVNIKTLRPLESPGQQASIGIKGVFDTSNERLPDSLQGDQVTPEISGIYSNTFADGKFGVAVAASYQVRHLGFSEVGVYSGWRTFKGSDENIWGTLPQEGSPGYENIVNRPGPDDLYSVPQNINYNVNGIQRERTNGLLTLQFAPIKELTATLDFAYSELKLQTKRNDLSAWFNFGPSASSWTDGPVAGPIYYTEFIPAANSDVAMGGALFATKNKNQSVGLNVAWKPTANLSFELDAHQSTATSGADSPYGSNAVLGTASYNRGTTSVDFSRDFPILSIEGATLDPSLNEVTGSSFRNSYMKMEIEQLQLNGKYKFDDGSRLNFGVGMTEVNNRSAYANIDSGTWSGFGNHAADYPDEVWRADRMGRYFGQMGNKNGLYQDFFTWDFKTVRDLAAVAANNENLYLAPTEFTTDRRVTEKSQSLFLQYGLDWELGVPMTANIGLRYEKTDVESRALVPTATGIEWGSTNEFTVLFSDPSFTKLKGSYSYLLPSLDFDADLTDRIKFRASYGETIGRPGWDQIQGGQTLNGLARLDGGTGVQGNPALKPLKSQNYDLSLEFYYAKGSYVAAGYFEKHITNYPGLTAIDATPFNLNTPSNGPLFQEAEANGNCAGDLVCIRNYIFENYNGTRGVQGTYDADADLWTGVITGQPDDPIANFRITTFENQKAFKLNGVELNWQHMFGNSGFGFSTNYTYVDSNLSYDNTSPGEQFAIEGVSDTANLVVFYENDWFETRVAYNWRDEFLAGRIDGGGFQNPVYTEAYSQVDLTAAYKLNQNLTFQFEVINLTDGTQRSHERHKNNLVAMSQTGPRYMIGARYKF